MATKSKTESNSRARSDVILEARRFLWHFESPWKALFKHDHWWKGKENEVPIEAVVWEILRRHPDAEAVHRNMHLDINPGEFRTFIGCHGFSAWLKLSKSQQSAFVRRIRKYLPTQHGWFTPPVIALNDRRPFKKHIAQLEKNPNRTQLGGMQKRLAYHLKTKVFEYHRAGHIIIAIDPNAHPRHISKIVEAGVKNWQGDVKPRDSGKLRADQWLKVIEKFEHEELSRDKSKVTRDDQLFARYHRAIENFSWPPFVRSDGIVLP